MSVAALDFERQCGEIVTQTTQLTGHLDGADLTVPVPSCPGWTVAQLVGHLDGGQRWAAEIVATRAGEAPPQDAVRDVGRYRHVGAAALAASISEAAALLAATLRDAGPDAQMWCPVDGGGAAFYARRFAHETVVHRADAALALGVPFSLDADVAVDGIEEWLELGCLPFHFEIHPWMRELLGAGRTIGLHAADTGTEWVVDFTGDTITWRSGGGAVGARVTAPVTDLLLLLYRRRPVTGLEVTGDAGLVDFWLERVGFG